MKEEIYKEVGSNYRFFLGWRHASFAGNLIVLYAVISLTISAHKTNPQHAFLIPLIASPIGLIFWMIDRRTRDLYHGAIRAGKALEGDDGGCYTELSKVILPPSTSSFKKITQSAALNIVFIGSSLLLVTIAWFLRRIA